MNESHTGATLPSWRYEEIKETMTLLLWCQKITHLPISGFEIARRRGINVIPYSHGTEELRRQYMAASSDGFNITDSEGHSTIYYNDEMPYERINFTILHEIAHIVLGHQEHSELAEKEANFAAGFLAAPPAALFPFNPQSPLEVEMMCHVSRQAAIHSFSRYQSWKRVKQHHPLTDYEQMLYDMFSKARREAQTTPK
ncbi:ImmA/IrrE family metallo-endopeptidase [Bifidobacterium stellenboschense]|uniref:Putative toxin-antitoxin system, toxin component n=1 Tax=Bifidobacterium stellenboschense TaxID=762211 RepID=A0A087DGE5_9BIFI|nr:ImmA/IrrE family metallo-endopeptidase [Bifidobacterium stellenboschense]KFI94595.1 putative toxin-antitoxin system, toxin component [Bifidobacterium stellenboschense]